jgi:hypothetical protein
MQVVEYDEAIKALRPVDLSGITGTIAVKFQAGSKTEELDFTIDAQNATNGEIVYESDGTEFAAGASDYLIQARLAWTDGKEIPTIPFLTTPQHLKVRAPLL